MMRVPKPIEVEVMAELFLSLLASVWPPSSLPAVVDSGSDPSSLELAGASAVVVVVEFPRSEKFRDLYS